MRDRVSQRRRAAQLARHYRDQENLTIAEIARRLGRAEATVKAYLYDPTGEKARAVKARYVGVCRGCGRVHAAAQRQGRRLPVLQGLPSGRDRAEVDAGAGARGDARLADEIRPAAVLLRLVTHARRAPRRGRPRTAGQRKVAACERRRPALRELAGSS